MNWYAATQVAVIALVSLAIKFLPYIIFPANRPRPAFITYLGTVLPYSLMGMLVIYCFKSTPILSAPHGIPELIAVLVVVFSYLWKKNSLVSIFIGTAVYMAVLRLI